MMKSILDAEKFSLTDAAKRVPVNVATLWRWAQKGVKGRRLATVQIGGRRYVLREDLEAFLDAGRDSAASTPTQPTLTARAVAAGEELARLGM